MDISSGEPDGEGSRGHQQQPHSVFNTVQGRSVGSIGGNEESSIVESAGSDYLRTKLDQREADFSKLKEKYNDVCQAYSEVEDENLRLQTYSGQFTQELKSTRQDNNSLKQELQACKDDLFRMQPRSRVPDSVVAQAYDDLDEKVCSWIASEISLFETDYYQTGQKAPPTLFYHRNSSSVKEFLSDHPTYWGEYLVRCLIRGLLQEMVFAEDILLLGLDNSEAALLQRIERGMGKGKPPRGRNFVRHNTTGGFS